MLQRLSSDSLATGITKMKALIIAGVSLLSFTATAATAAAVDPNDGLLEILKSAYSAITSGHYAYAAAVSLIFACAVAKRYGAKYIPALNSDIGGTLLVLFGSLGGALATSLVDSSVNLSWGLMSRALSVALAAAGGYSMLKRLVVVPLLKPLMAKLPVWAQPILQMVLWVFDKPDALATAKQAGDAAVAAKPAPGIDGIIKAKQ